MKQTQVKQDYLQIAFIIKDVNYEMLDVIRSSFPNRLIVVTPSVESKSLNGYEFLNDNDFFNRENFFRSCTHPRPGWLYQQFLKYQVVLKSQYDHTLIVDGDSLLIDEKFLSVEKMFFTRKNIEKSYNLFIEKVLGREYCVSRNFITNQMNFHKATLKDMLELNFGSVDNFCTTISDVLKLSPECEFSEYQTYASWVLKKQNLAVEKIKVFRRHDLVSANVADSLRKYDLVAYENSHKSGGLRKLRANVYYKLGVNLG